MPHPQQQLDVNVVLGHLKEHFQPRAWDDGVTIATQRAQLDLLAEDLAAAQRRVDELEIELTSVRSAALPGGLA